jgi:hypothetical protein
MLKPLGEIRLSEDLSMMNRGFSARRYVNTLTKNWDQGILDKFISSGKIKNGGGGFGGIDRTKSYDDEAKEMKRKRLDDLTQLPQAYKLERNLINELNSNRTYKFIKIDHSTTTSATVAAATATTPTTPMNNHVRISPKSAVIDLPVEQQPNSGNRSRQQQKFLNLDSIKVIDKNSAAEVNYRGLNMNEKRKVLSDLLYQSAVNNIMKNQIVNH